MSPEKSLREKIAEIIKECEVGQSLPPSFKYIQSADRILDLVREELPEKERHNHDSIPCYTGYADEGCITCIRNDTIDTMRERMGQ